jgi:hypothetical protein
MSGITPKDHLDYAWKHFALIADQRVKTFNFYIIVVLAAFGATLGAIKPSTPRHLYCLIGVGHIFIVAVFGMIEARGRMILDIAKRALREIEGSADYGEAYRPMTEDDRSRSKGPGGLITYGNAFLLTFLGHFLFGFLIAAWPGLFVVRP